MPRRITSESTYVEKLVKLIPGEIIAAYLAILGIVQPHLDYRFPVLIISIIVLLLLIPYYLRAHNRVTSWRNILITMVSFLVWVVNLGGPFEDIPGFESWLGSILIILWTLAAPVLAQEEGGT